MIALYSLKELLTRISLALVATVGMSNVGHGGGCKSDGDNEGLHLDGRVAKDCSKMNE
jgi:hypothetical protein